MRVIRFLFFYALLSIFGITVILFLLQNRRGVRLDLFGPEYTINLAWLLLGAAACSALAVLVFLLPGRIAVTMLTWRLERELRQLEQDLWGLQAQRERLLERHDRTLEAHERLLLTYQRLVDEYNRLLRERDEVRAHAAVSRIAAGGAASAPARRAQEPTMLPRVSLISPASSAPHTSQPSAATTEAPTNSMAHATQSARAAGPAPQQARLVPVTHSTVQEVREGPHMAPNTESPAATHADAPYGAPQQVPGDTDRPTPQAEPRRVVMEVGLAPVLVGPERVAHMYALPSFLTALTARIAQASAALAAFIVARTAALRIKIEAQLVRLGQRQARPAVIGRSPGAPVSEEARQNLRQTDGVEDPAYRQ